MRDPYSAGDFLEWMSGGYPREEGNILSPSAEIIHRRKCLQDLDKMIRELPPEDRVPNAMR